jgi:hypothetical protein
MTRTLSLNSIPNLHVVSVKLDDDVAKDKAYVASTHEPTKATTTQAALPPTE